MKRLLTVMNEQITIALVGQTESSYAEVQLAGDSQLKATNWGSQTQKKAFGNPCRWGGSFTPAIPFYELLRQFGALLCLKKPDKTAPPKADSVSAEGSKSLLTVKRICPIHAEPVQLSFTFYYVFLLFAL